MPHFSELSRRNSAPQMAATRVIFALVVGCLVVMLSCKQSSSGRLGSVGPEADQGTGASGQGLIRAVRGQLDFDLTPGGVGAAVPAPSGNGPSGAAAGVVVGQPIRIVDPKASTAVTTTGTVRMEFAIILDGPVSQLTDVHGGEGGGTGGGLRRVGFLSTSNLIFEPESLRSVAEEMGRALYLVESGDCGVAQRCVRLSTGGESLKEDKQSTIRLELRETRSGQWILKGFRYFGHAMENDYGMPVRLVLTDRFDG